MFPFPLFHGTSTHYAESFMPGGLVRPRLHKEAGLALFRQIWDELRECGVQPEWWATQVLNQTSGRSNWQHGELYASPSKSSAERYARSNAACGGELLTMCRQYLDILEREDGARFRYLWERSPHLHRFLDGGGEPLLVEFRDVPFSAATAELGNSTLTPREAVDFVDGMGEDFRDILGQQINFRLNIEAVRVN